MTSRHDPHTVMGNQIQHDGVAETLRNDVCFEASPGGWFRDAPVRFRQCKDAAGNRADFDEWHVIDLGDEIRIPFAILVNDMDNNVSFLKEILVGKPLWRCSLRAIIENIRLLACIMRTESAGQRRLPRDAAC